MIIDNRYRYIMVHEITYNIHIIIMNFLFGVCTGKYVDWGSNINLSQKPSLANLLIGVVTSTYRKKG